MSVLLAFIFTLRKKSKTYWFPNSCTPSGGKGKGRQQQKTKAWTMQSVLLLKEMPPLPGLNLISKMGEHRDTRKVKVYNSS